MKRLLFSVLVTLSTSATAYADCASDFRRVMDDHAKAGPYHVAVDFTAKQKQVRIDVDVILPDKFHMTSGSGGKIDEETILTETAGWDKTWTTPWRVLSPERVATARVFFKNGLSGGFTDITNLQCLGKRDFEGKPFNVFSFDKQLTAGTKKVSSHIELYVTNKNLPAVLVGTAGSGEAASKSIQHISYDSKIEIKPPI